jgi:ABC-type bacteriocin/lantibiotic exporter with double-glycine peptidase domain
MASLDCGAACLAMVLGYHGRPTRLEEVRRATGIGRDGGRLAAIIHAAEAYGLRARAVSVELAAVAHLPPASVLFWDFRHYVVLERIRRGAVDLVDPAAGRRRVSRAELRRHFTGVAAVFEPAATFASAPDAPRRTWRPLLQALVRAGGLPRILGLSVLLQLAALALPLTTRLLVDRVLPRGDRGLLPALALGAVTLVAFSFTSSLARAHLLVQLSARLDLQLTQRFVEHLVRLPYLFFQTRPAGDLALRMNSNATMREILTAAVLSTLLDGALVVLYLALLAAASPALAGLAVLLGGLNVGLFVATRGRQRLLLARGLAAQARRASYEVEMLTGMETLKALGAEGHALERWRDLLIRDLDLSLTRGRLNALCNSLSGALQMASPLALLLCGGALVMAGRLSLGTMLALGALAAGFLGPLGSLLGTAGQVQLLGSYFERQLDVLETAPEQPPTTPPEPPRLRGEVALEGVSFRYAPLAPPVVRDVTLHVAAGQHVALVGRSGAGKSTLARLLLGLYEPSSGRVRFDGLDLAQLDRRAVRAQMGVVTQQPQLFAGSIRDNITLGAPDVELDEVVAAARLARVHEDVVAMPMGYDTLLSDRGLSLSGGQRQRLALARALVRRPAILLLDEATSDVDALTEREIQEALTGLRCTRITIAHRLSTVRDADVILVLHAGAVTERGRYAELTARPGPFADLIASQLARAAGSGDA